MFIETQIASDLFRLLLFQNINQQIESFRKRATYESKANFCLANNVALYPNLELLHNDILDSAAIMVVF